ncbi:hypothetical protein C2845_PM05G08970 [Panicum miliaceum]|uniref:AB hydrolase-1 domain-containing protein n=1 Tax=Panicum miliaceum TaxID=4540 RepID=A0A3L6SWH3_PANMI|nr:hypothetical protein C2845_PM05G08970 [Panicum miliaceum]
MPPRRSRRRSVVGIDQDELLDPEALADPDSSFYEINGVRLHHKVCSHEDEDSPSDQSSGTTVSAAGQSRIGLPILLLHGYGASVFSWSRVMRPLARIAGAKVLAFDRPAFGQTSRASWSGDDSKPLNPYSIAFSVMATLAFIDYLGAEKAVLVGIWGGFLALCKHIAGLVSKMIMAIRGVAQALYVKALVAFLRSSLGAMLVRWAMDKFGILGVRVPLRSRGWEIALLEHTISMIIDSVSATRVPVSKISCPVLVVTGDTDRIVPAWNTERVAHAIPGANFEVIKSCGHLPQEERPEEFLSVVERFLRTVFGTPNEQVFQAAV